MTSGHRNWCNGCIRKASSWGFKATDPEEVTRGLKEGLKTIVWDIVTVGVTVGIVWFII